MTYVTRTYSFDIIRTILRGIFKGSLPPSSSPDPISDQTMPFFYTYFRTWPLKSIPIHPDLTSKWSKFIWVREFRPKWLKNDNLWGGTCCTYCKAYLILSLVQFWFSIFFSMLIYDNDCQIKENQNWTKDKIELLHISPFLGNI